MRIATWNVNSIKQRLPRFLPWLDERQPDVVCLQETKLADDAIAELLDDELAQRGYQAAYYGQAQWNGVALLSKVGLDDVVRGLPDAPGFPDLEARAVSADLRGHSGALAVRAQRPHRRLGPLPVQAGLARGAAPRRGRPDRPTRSSAAT